MVLVSFLDKMIYMTVPSQCIIYNSILSFGTGFMLFGIAIIIVIYRTVCGTSVVIQEVWISHIDGHLHHWYINSLRVIATIGFQILNINNTIHRYPVWMPQTTRQCMKCHRFSNFGVWGWGEHFLYKGFGRWHFDIGVLPWDPVHIHSIISICHCQNLGDWDR